MSWTQLSPRARLLFYLQAFSRLFLFWVPVTLGAVFAGSFAIGLKSAALVGVGWLFVLFLSALWMPALAWERWAYALRETDLLIARGVLVHTVTAIPLARIQHVDVQRGPIEQWFGLAQVQIHTASGGLRHDGGIPGLAVEDAEALRDTLLRISGDDGV